MYERNSELNGLQNRVDAFLSIPVAQPAAQVATERVAAASRQRFSPFNPAQMQHVTELAGHFMALANSKEGVASLSAVLDEADKAAATEDPELVRYALMLFITHYPQGSQLKVRLLEKRAPQLVLPSRPPAIPLRIAAATTEVPSEASLNWFREDPKANEHHEHWHLVYPFSGIPDPNNPDSVQVKDRQGELFLYMHEQMIARYNAERLAVGLAFVKPFPSSDDYSERVPDGYDPDPHLVEDQPSSGRTIPFSSRPAGQQFTNLGRPGHRGYLRVADLKQWGDNLLQAAQSGFFQDGRPVSADLLGATLEASINSADSNVYGNHHNLGHVFLANVNDPQHYPQDVPGVMNTPITAIRDPIFFRWHKHIDDISFQWQETQGANDFSDAPAVLIRKALNATAPANQSPDIILCFKDKIRSGSDDSDAFWQAYGETNFGGTNWDRDFSSSDTTTNELQTAMRQRQITISLPEGDNQAETILYLYPREFFYFLRVENQLAQAKEVTVRIFLAPTGSYAGVPEVAEDRRMWIEMDKFRYTLRPSQRAVIFRRADASSVIRKPAVKTFDVSDTDDDTGDVSCDCGWPYNLLLPRGTRNGMTFRLMVMITDWEKDRVPDEATCGSMSYCGAKDKYPDTRGMGYPFDRPFPSGQSIAQTIAAQNNMAARDITIKWVDSLPG